MHLLQTTEKWEDIRASKKMQNAVKWACSVWTTYMVQSKRKAIQEVFNVLIYSPKPSKLVESENLKS